MGQRSVYEIGEDGLDDCVATMGDIGGGGRFVGVGEERVIPPHRESAHRGSGWERHLINSNAASASMP